MRADALLNFGCARRKEPFVWPARLSMVIAKKLMIRAMTLLSSI